MPIQSIADSRAPLWLAGMLAVAATALAADRVLMSDLGGYSHMALAHSVLYLVTAGLLLSSRARAPSLFAILAIALVMRGIAMGVPHNVLTTDALRYVWDGRIQWAGFNPYLYAPADERLAFLRDLVIFPNINQKETAVTIYPPFAEMIFMLAVKIADGIEGMKLTMLAFEGLLVWSLVGCLDRLGISRDRVLIYAWHPLPVWEFASQAHIDAATAALITAALYARLVQRYWLTGMLLGLAAATKYYPALLLAVLLPRPPWLDRLLRRIPGVRSLIPDEAAGARDECRTRQSLPDWLQLSLGFVATLIAVYLPYAWTAGPRVIGFLNRHLDNEGYLAGYGFHLVWILRDFGLADPPARAYIAAAAVTLGALLAWAFLSRRARDVPIPSLVVIACAFVWLTSPHYAWYFAWIIPFAALAPSPAALLFTALAFVMYLPTIAPAHGQSIAYALVFGVPLVVASVERWRARTRLPET
ncbi:MAG TPA: glycosyltransferase 87 family protein [Hyphomicrobiaceae bacterium]|nr:glycosyltransferase 87 family protein [Hyphomicrobiaceae bacterium]